jgi:hypothetical protein
VSRCCSAASVIWPDEAFARLPDANAHPRTMRERCGS